MATTGRISPKYGKKFITKVVICALIVLFSLATTLYVFDYYNKQGKVVFVIGDM